MINIARQAATITLAVTLLVPVAGAETPEIRIFGSANEIIAEYKSANFWGKIEKGAAIDVPPYLTIATSPTWNKDSAILPVNDKKELFYRSLLPLILYSNETILENRVRLEKIADTPKGTENEWLAGLAANYGLLKEDEVLPEELFWLQILFEA